ncbi:Enoyl-(Acyl carrier protein) reductase-like protein 21 [Elsinoe fawcettii]|nr:Enoyl-(Acyl carrier protein) reductase-like protein 21 [Elsinoe fawcettii]
MDLFDLSGQTAVITGAARGLGLAFAEVLATAKCNIAALDILLEPSPALLELPSKHGVELQYYRVDITSEADVSKALEQIEARFPSIDINVNAAGIVKDEPFLTTTLANIERTFAVNFTGSFLVARACAQSMVRRQRNAQPVIDTPSASVRNDPSKQGGSIVFIGSIATHTASSAQQISAYVASKGAIRSMVKPLAMELAPYGIRVNSLSPGYMMTDMMRGLQGQQPDLVKQFEEETMFGRIGNPDEVKGTMLFLCARGASGWVTGQDILVDGGATSWKHPARLQQCT